MGGCDHNSSIAASKVVDQFAGLHLGNRQHLIDDRVGCRIFGGQDVGIGEPLRNGMPGPGGQQRNREDRNSKRTTKAVFHLC